MFFKTPSNLKRLKTPITPLDMYKIRITLFDT